MNTRMINTNININKIIYFSAGIIFITICSIALMSCKYNIEGKNIKSDLNAQSTWNNMVSYDDCIYYYKYSGRQIAYPDGSGSVLEQIMYKYNEKTKEIFELDRGAYFGNMFFIDNKIYYLKNNDDFSKSILLNRGLSDIESAKTECEFDVNPLKIEYSPLYGEQQIFSIDNKIYINISNNVYLLENEKAVKKADDITSLFKYKGYIYFSNKRGDVYKYDITSQIKELILSEEEIKNSDMRMSVFGSCINVRNIIIDNDTMYFIVCAEEYPIGKIMYFSLDDKNTLQVFPGTERMSASYFSVYKNSVYFNFDGKMMCSSQDKTIEILNPLYRYNILDNKLYCLTITSDNQTEIYSKDLNDEKSVIEKCDF